MAVQLNLFSEEETIIKKTMPAGGSNNPIVFRDYESFVAKFQDAPKTTDDCFTPPDVYEAVVEYVSSVYDMTDKVILRPFFPGGDYERAEYPENGVVIDNPPFSLFSFICKFYIAHKIPFFLFGPGLTILSACKYGATAVIINQQITFHNGAVVRLNFASNLFGDILFTTAPHLDALLKDCPSQNTKKNLPRWQYPDQLISVSELHTICGAGIEYKAKRSESVICRDLDNLPSKGLYGDHYLVSDEKGKEKTEALSKARDISQFRPVIELSERERKIVEKL